MTTKRNNSESPLEKLKDFRVFVTMVWRHLGLPDPTPLQLDICKSIQFSPNRMILQAFRGIGKSYITSSYVLWRLLFDRNLKIAVISASANLATRFTTHTLGLINSMPILACLKPTADQRCSTEGFDVGGCTLAPTPSVWSMGITGQLTGNRADIVIADDIEVPNNSNTYDQREKLLDRISEFSAILKTGNQAKILYLGTPQCEDSIYTRLVNDREYFIRIYPALIPTEKQKAGYGEGLAPYITSLKKKEGEPTDPERFTIEEITKKRLDYAEQGFALQYMLDTSLTDGDRSPLKLHNLVVTDVHESQAPECGYLWTNNRDFLCDKTIPCSGLSGDRFFRPSKELGEYKEFTSSVMAIDPAGHGGKGSDELAYVIVKALNGFLYLVDVGGFFGNDEAVAIQLAERAKLFNVNKVLVESNYGGGAFESLLIPVFGKIHSCHIEGIKHSGQKEKRIIDTLFPIMSRHKLIVSSEAIKRDKHIIDTRKLNNEICYSLFWQMSRITSEKNAIQHDDRLDVLAMACAHFANELKIDEVQQLKARQRADQEKFCREFLEEKFLPGYRPKHSGNGHRVHKTRMLSDSEPLTQEQWIQSLIDEYKKY